MPITQTGHCTRCFFPFQNARSKKYHYAKYPEHDPKRIRLSSACNTTAAVAAAAAVLSSSRRQEESADVSTNGHHNFPATVEEVQCEYFTFKLPCCILIYLFALLCCQSEILVPPLESFSYYGSFKLEQEHGLRHVYDIDDLLYENDFDESELLSIKFRDIFDRYPASREMARELTYFINTIIKNIKERQESNDEVNEGTLLISKFNPYVVLILKHFYLFDRHYLSQDLPF